MIFFIAQCLVFKHTLKLTLNNQYILQRYTMITNMRTKIFNTFGLSAYLLLWIIISYIHFKGLDATEDYTDYLVFNDSTINLIFVIVLGILKMFLCVFCLLLLFWINLNFINKIGLMFMNFVKIVDAVSAVYLGYYTIWLKQYSYIPWLILKLIDSAIMWLIISSIEIKKTSKVTVKIE